MNENNTIKTIVENKLKGRKIVRRQKNRWIEGSCMVSCTLKSATADGNQKYRNLENNLEGGHDSIWSVAPFIIIIIIIIIIIYMIYNSHAAKE